MSLSTLTMALITIIPITRHFSVPKTPLHAVPYLLLDHNKGKIRKGPNLGRKL